MFSGANMGTITIPLPDELTLGFKELNKKEISSVVSKALKEKLSERLMFKVAGELLKNSKITDELALKWGSELKKKASKKHWS